MLDLLTRFGRMHFFKLVDSCESCAVCVGSICNLIYILSCYGIYSCHGSIKTYIHGRPNGKQLRSISLLNGFWEYFTIFKRAHVTVWVSGPAEWNSLESQSEDLP